MLDFDIYEKLHSPLPLFPNSNWLDHLLIFKPRSFHQMLR